MAYKVIVSARAQKASRNAYDQMGSECTIPDTCVKPSSADVLVLAVLFHLQSMIHLGTK
jgi:hypothetical protein